MTLASEVVGTTAEGKKIVKATANGTDAPVSTTSAGWVTVTVPGIAKVITVLAANAYLPTPLSGHMISYAHPIYWATEVSGVTAQNVVSMTVGVYQLTSGAGTQAGITSSQAYNGAFAIDVTVLGV